MAPVQQPHCPSTQEQGSLGGGRKGRFVVVDDGVDTADSVCAVDSVTLLSSAAVPKTKFSA